MTILVVSSIVLGVIGAIGGTVQKKIRIIDAAALLVLATTAGGLLIFSPRNGQSIQVAMVLMVAYWIVFGRHIKRKMDQQHQP